MRFEREIRALNAYVIILEKNGVAEDMLREHKLIILALAPYLESIPLNGQHYRVAVDAFSKVFTKAEWEICIPEIREYYSFWIDDTDSIVEMNQGGDFKSDTEEWSPETIENINVLLDSLSDFQLTEAELDLLQTYKIALPNRSHDKFFIHTHLRLASFLIFGLRSISQKNANEYRRLVDGNLTLFSSNDEKRIFLTVTRQMYFHWAALNKASV